MKISLVNKSVTFFDSKGDLHMNTELSKTNVEVIQELIRESMDPKITKGKSLEIENKLLSIITPKFVEAKKEVKKATKAVKAVKKKAKQIEMGKEAGKYFAFDKTEGGFYYKGYKNAENVILPNELVDHIIEVEEKGESILPFVHFWELALANPDPNARDGLFKFVKKQRLIITQSGYIVCYRRAQIVEGDVDPRLEFILNEITRLRKQKGNLKKYSFGVKGDEYLTLDHRTKKYKDFKETTDTYYDLSQKYENGENGQVVLTDAHTKRMRFGLGSVVSIPRNECDGNPNNECSNGLHIGSRQYVGSGECFGQAAMLCLVNPSKVVSVPYRDAHKMRVCEYKIISLHKNFNEIEKFEDSDIKVMEHDYINHEVNEIEELLQGKEFKKENYSQNAEVFIKYTKAQKDIKFSTSGLEIDNKELENMRRKINRRK